ncbi:hypothetical protein AMJ39_03380 [candidate division TA06 bacterium DG_24]|nr:MAG: hypothetical protein AMJ39_03380 [candidate division TA06 bacterium DG_24]KPK67308.1 MAG: hypothetical protein AMJ82_10900 [candidate division TA06 bacterium SM23_40]
MKWAVAIACAALILAQAASGTIIRVPEDYSTIQAGINAASFGDTVLVGPGLYEETITLAYGVYVTSEYGPAYTEITAHGHIITGADSSVFEGFRVTNDGLGTSWGYGWSESTTIIRRNVFIGHYVGLHCGQTGSAETIVNNVITDNAHSGITFGWDAAPIIENNIVYDNNAGLHHYGTGYAPTIDYNDVWNNVTNYSNVTPGPNDISADPNFLNTAKRDWRLLWPSPCIDAGNPATHYNDPDGTRNDIGAYYFHQGGPAAIYLTPDTTTVARGGSLGVTYTAINPSPTQPLSFYAKTEATLPNGNPFPVFLKQAGLGPGETKQVYITHTVPMAAPLGLYLYTTYIGVPPNTLWDTDVFPFSVEP